MNTTTATSSEPVLKARDANARPCKVFQDRGSADRDLLRNGDGPTVMLRADMDALPIEEMTGLPYASKIKMKDRQGNMVPVGHMCGHDMHVTCLIGATELFAQVREAWHGNLLAVFQPAEETAEGAQAMVGEGRIKYREDVGLENAPRALIGLLRGENFGKLLVHVAR